MSKINENFIKAIESLSYNIDEEVINKDCISILKDVTQKYIELFEINDLNEDDRNCIKNILKI